MSLFRSLIIWSLLLVGGQAQAIIYAEFTTNRTNQIGQPIKFWVDLDPVNAPLTVTHFSMLAGKPDDVWKSNPQAPLPIVVPGGFSTTLLGYESTPEPGYQLEARENIVIRPIVESEGSLIIKEYQIVSVAQSLELGRVSALPNGRVYEDVTGRGRIEMTREQNSPFRLCVTMKYPRPWLKPFAESDLELEIELPYYQNLVASSLTGTRLNMGTRTIAGVDVSDPGFFVPDELVKVPNDQTINNRYEEHAYRAPFNFPYVIAMDNEGPGTNGSRFFITNKDPALELNGHYTAFGKIEIPQHRQIVDDLITTAQGNPGTVLITSIKVKRRAPFIYTGFFESYYQKLLPGGYTDNVELSMVTVDGKPELRAFSPQPGTPESASLLTRIYAGSDLENFEFIESSGIATGLTEPTKQFVDAVQLTGEKGFFRATAWEYPNWPSADVTLENAIYEFTVRGPGNSIGELTLVFNLEGTGGTFVNTTQVERSEVRVNPDYEPGNGLSPLITIHTLEPEVQTVRSGTFEATYSPSQGPYAGTIQISATSGELEIDHIEIQYSFNPQDHRPDLLPSASVPNGYRAYKDEPNVSTDEGGTLIPLEYEGVYYKSQ